MGKTRYELWGARQAKVSSEQTRSARYQRMILKKEIRINRIQTNVGIVVIKHNRNIEHVAAPSRKET